MQVLQNEQHKKADQADRADQADQVVCENSIFFLGRFFIFFKKGKKADQKDKIADQKR